MTKEQENHLLEIKHDFVVLVDEKYRKGQEEHGGNLFDMGAIKLIDAALDEAIDMVVYLMTLKSQSLKLLKDINEVKK